MTATAAESDAHPSGPLLDRARGLVDALLQTAVQETPARMRLICGYQLGWWESDGRPSSAGSGKALRPALALAAAKAAGGRTADAVPAAAAVELVHNFSLLHDDVLDRDETRRHRPTAWKAFGTADAILAGDAMLALAPHVLADRDRPAPPEAARRLGTCVIELCEGQHLDCAFEQRDDVGTAECLRMAQGKTGALLGLSCALGALAAGAPNGVVIAMDTFGRRLGLAFQLVDDLLGIWGDPAVTGKPAGADLQVRKKSLPVVAALAAGTEPARRLRALYALRRPLTTSEVARAGDLVAQAGGRTWAQEKAQFYTASALGILDGSLPPTSDDAELRALAALITRRKL
ncbi:family 2 encapsulin nanocompartment cargo protein polyprenyl transferase [Kitasatospora sp. NPDC002040]|uniref:family 2 encapsulin nanocompartment cargo protein polyprenyl transferase n=1 Tax=Kitasatospora sp. NPDC002040 TaxID=3154661 RepID=UPI003329D5BF